LLVVALGALAVDGFLLATRSPLCTAARPVTLPARFAIEMGRGDKRTAKGKRKYKSFGNSRPRNSKLRRERDGPMPSVVDMGSAQAAAATVPAVEDPPVEAEPLVKAEALAASATGGGSEYLATTMEPAVAVEEPAAAVEEPVVEPEAVAEEPAAIVELKPAEIAAKVKELRAQLPKADLKTCKAAVVEAAGDLEVAKAALLAQFSAEWDAADAAEAAALAEGLAAVQARKDAKAAKKFEKEEAERAAAAAAAAAAEVGEAAPGPEPVAEAPVPEPEVVAEEAAPELEPVMEAAAPEPEPVVVQVAPPEPELVGAGVAGPKKVRLPNADDLGNVWVR